MENIFIYPFIKIGNFLAWLKPLKQEYDIFFFFPFYHVGGVEKYNAALANATVNKKGIIFFTKKSIDNTFLNEFKKSNHKIIDVSRYTDNKWIYFCNLLFRGIITGYINKCTLKPIVFNGQSNLGYKISPWVNKQITQYECIHTFSSFSYIRQPFVEFYKKVFSPSHKTINDHKIFYKKIKVPNIEFEKFTYLLTGINLPKPTPENTKSDSMQVIFVGRGSPEKRLNIAATIAKKVQEQNNNIKFLFVGDVEKYISKNLIPYCILKGNIADKEEMERLYNDSEILILTSAYEGFPLVVMEAMSNGLAILSTDVGDVPFHVKNNLNGFIIENKNKDEVIIENFKEYILRLDKNKNLLHNMAQNNKEYSALHYDINNLQQQIEPYFKQ